MKPGDRIAIKIIRLGADYKAEMAIVPATIVEVNRPFSFVARYDEPQDGYEMRAFPFDAIPEYVTFLDAAAPLDNHC